MITRAIWLVPAAMLLGALAELPYGYYTLLRIVVCACCLVILYQAHMVLERTVSVWTVALGAMALLFNPLVRVHLTREIWAPIDVVCAAVLIAHMLIERDKTWRTESRSATRKRTN